MCENEIQDSTGIFDGWFAVQTEVIRQHGKTLRPTGIAIYVAICSFSRNGSCFPSHKKLADLIGVCKDTVKEYLKLMEELELIEIQPRIMTSGSRTSNLYILKKVAGGEDGGRGNTSPQGRGNTSPHIEQDQVNKTSEQDQVNNVRDSANSKFERGGFELEQRPEPSWFDKMTVMLVRGLEQKRKLLRKPNLFDWSNKLRNFVFDAEHLELDEIEKVLIWYSNHVGDSFIPKAYSMSSFCDRFVDISDAKERWERDSRSDTTGSVFETMRKKMHAGTN